MNDDAREYELSMDELDSVNAGGAIVPLLQRAAQLAHARAVTGVCDDSV